MRLLIVEFRDWTNPRAGGAERTLHEAGRRLAARGWRIDYLCSAYPGAKPEETLDGIRIVRRGREGYFALVPALALRGSLRGERYDLILEGIDKVPFFLPWLAPRALRGRIAALVPHLLGETAGEAAGFLAGAAVGLAEALLPRCYRRCVVATVGESTRAELEARGLPPKRLRLVPNGIDHDVYRPGPAPGPDAPYFLYVGRLRRYKTVETALRALALLERDDPAARLVVVGEGDDRPRLERLARELGVAARVEFRGFVPGVEKVALMQGATALVYPSRKEGWGLPVLEAAACGVPAVVSDVPGLRDAVRDGVSGVLVPFGDAPGFARELLRLRRDAAWRDRLREGALRRAAEFDWDTSASALEAALKSAMVSHP